MTVPIERQRRQPTNLLLRSLSIGDAAILHPMLTCIHCPRGEPLGVESSAQALIYFPESIVASLTVGTGSASIGLIGYEGLIGWAALIGGCDLGLRARVMLEGGEALTIPAQRLQIACFASPTLTLRLLRFIQTFSLQMGASLHSALSDPLDTRLCAWLLMVHDRIESNEIGITHTALGQLLKVRRASITDALHRLEGYRAVRCTRNRIEIRDREVLHALAGCAYGATEHAYRRSFGAFGKSIEHAEQISVRVGT